MQKFYEQNLAFFIPGKWHVPIQISLQFCQLTGDQLNEQLTKHPEKSINVLNAKKRCEVFEKELGEIATQWLKKQVDEDEIDQYLPEYKGIISGVCEKHLKSYLQNERQKAEKSVMLAKDENFTFLYNEHQLHELLQKTTHKSEKLKSTELLLTAMREGLHKCVQISRGQQLVDLLLEHQDHLQQYGNFLLNNGEDACQNNGVINVTHVRRKATGVVNTFTIRYLWIDSIATAGSVHNRTNQAGKPFEENDSKSNTNGGSEKLSKGAESLVIQQLLIYLSMLFNSAVYCKISVPNLAKAAQKLVETKELQEKIDFTANFELFESLETQVREFTLFYCGCYSCDDFDVIL